MTRALLFLSVALVAGVAFAGRPPEAVDADRIAAEAEVKDLERRSRALEEQQALRRSQLKKRLRALYKLSNGGTLRLLAGASSVEELDTRRESVRRVVTRDLEELRSVRAEARELDIEQARRKEALARALDFGSQVALADVAPAAGLQLKQSALVRPVAGPVVGAWGVHRDAALGVTLTRRGIELRTHAAELIRAPAAGRVRFVGDVPGLGHGVAIDHGDGYVTLIARVGITRCAVDDQVGDGDVIGEATGPTIYLELAQAGTPIDPTHWLSRR
ncbi:MAG: Peptidase [Myxococcales bacterium]|nr:Peptidase [Myxococcales bacterium]